MIDTTDFKNAMSLLTSAVNVVTTAGASGRYGFTASAVCSVTDSPPTLLVCMNRGSYVHRYFVENKVLSVNILGAQQQAVADVFASKLTSEARFKHGQWGRLVTGAPVLNDALASVDCRIEHIQSVGTHDIFICPIVAIQQAQSGQGLAYFGRAYHHLGQTTAA